MDTNWSDDIAIAELSDEPGLSEELAAIDSRVVDSSKPPHVVLNFGQVIAQGVPAVVQADPEVNRAYLGSGNVHELRAKLQAAAHPATALTTAAAATPVAAHQGASA